MGMLLTAGICLGTVATAAASTAANLPAIDPGPRPLRLVQDLEEGPLKRRLLSCAQGPFQRTAFAIGHRGACLAYPEHTRESYLAAARQGAGIIECDVTFTKDLELVCRHAQNDLHTSTDILSIPDLAAKCRRPFTPATFAADGRLLTPASAECWTSDLTLAEFRRLRGRRDGFNPRARTAAEYQQPPDIAWSGLEAGAEHGTLLTHRESIALFQELGVMMIPELKESLVPLPFNGLSRAALAQRLIDDYQAAGVDPRRVWPQSFLREDIRYWLAHEPDFGRQAVYLEAAERVADLPSLADLRGYRAEGIRIVAPPLFALLEGDASGAIRPSAYARNVRAAGLAIVPWSLERSGSLATPDIVTSNGAVRDSSAGAECHERALQAPDNEKLCPDFHANQGTNLSVAEVTDTQTGADFATDKGFYYQTLNAAIRREGDVLRVLDVLAREVGIIAIFSDWPATVVYYANCMGLANALEVR